MGGRVMLQYKTQIVLKPLDFIDDKELQVVLERRLDELERAFSVNANLSTIVLSISCIEGIFRHLASIFRDFILVSPEYPRMKDGNKKKFSKLTIEEIYKLLLERDILQRIKNFDQIYSLFRNYRNFIHPQRQRKESWPVGLGQAQMALGLLNATIDQISNYIFIGPETLVRISGRPRFDLSKVLHLDLADTRTHSFMLLKRKIDSDLDIKFNLDLGQRALFNFVFNFVDEGNFKMLRLDNREHDRTPNALLYSKQRFHWYIVARADQRQPPAGVISLRIIINFTDRQFTFAVDGTPYKFLKDNGEEMDLFTELKRGLRIGWFNEEGPVKLSNIQIS